jgi:hypothetical protein
MRRKPLTEVVEEETPYDEGSSKYLTVRMSEFYGMGREEWLTLIIKVRIISESRNGALSNGNSTAVC